ncbi:MAG: hypothetical protein PHY29_04355 [Syntrophales bacterium]|nr:hypothetical protein [Syntrophales bacterium]
MIRDRVISTPLGKNIAAKGVAQEPPALAGATGKTNLTRCNKQDCKNILRGLFP